MNILLYGYQRPHFSDQAIRNLLAWEKLDRLFITIDGLRRTANQDEQNWRLDTIRVVEKYAEIDSRIKPLIWSDNPGLTNHSIRTLRKCFEVSDSIIQLEDDNQISHSGLKFLEAIEFDGHEPGIRSAYNKSIHMGISDSVKYRSSIFPVQWGTSFNLAMFESFVDSWTEKKIDSKIVRSQISSIPHLSRITRIRLEKYWVDYFNKSIISPRHGDIVMQYATFKEGIKYKIPLIDEVNDLSSMDWRGMNQRDNTESIENHILKNAAHLTDGFICAKCELRNSRIEPKVSQQILKSIKVRTTI